MSHSPNCRRCYSRQRSSCRFRRLSNMMPGPIQEALNSFMLPFTVETIAKGHDGFEELRKYIKQGNEFSKELAAIMHERSELETSYAKTLSKLGAKLAKAAGNGIGSLADGWKAVATAMEQEAELHKNLGTGLMEEIGKPVKGLVESQNKSRRPIESMVDKAFKNLTDRRADEYKAKKHCYACAKEHEKAEDASTDAKSGKAKDTTKIEKRCKHSLSAVRKADKDYTELSYKAESVRQDWDLTVCKGSVQMQHIEEERVKHMQDYLNKYNSQVSVLSPRLTQTFDRLNEAVISIDLQRDLQLVVQQKGVKTPKQPEQLLIDCYAEDSQFSMKIERRKEALQNFLFYIQQAMDRDRKGKEGVQKLVDVYRNKPNFGDAEAQQDVVQRLEQTTFMLNFLEASHYKICATLAKHNQREAPQHKFSQYIETSREKQGMLVSVLKLPLNLALEGSNEYTAFPSTPNNFYQELQPLDEEGYYGNDSDPEFELDPIGQCRVKYEYKANHSDELNIKPGDEIKIFDKLADGWWQGELRGQVGIFPSTYVDEF
ncbi:nostrin-like isoform X2 [Gigantopelta aegis]|uniref:nostrin-like isoform X2 n=1 Tax=Gigantopelta aegis TaxID=1735272 RepID=UPI001B88D481|nr:nostrin-like isoform X2 [Gigantopelta aegis]